MIHGVTGRWPETADLEVRAPAITGAETERGPPVRRAGLRVRFFSLTSVSALRWRWGPLLV